MNGQVEPVHPIGDPGPAERRDGDLRAEARAWFVRLLENPTEAQRAKFESWKQLSPAHHEAFLKVEAAWNASEKPGQRLAMKEADELAVYLKAIDKAKGQRKTFRRLTALSIVLALALTGGVWLERPGLIQNMTADFATARGERRTITLPDGSTALLNADSALAEEYSNGERRVKLIRGAAFFDVIHSATPFVVAAANGEVRVLGTRFDVHLVEDGGLVTLERGRVAVSVESHSDTTILEPGQQVRFGKAGIGSVETVDLGDALAWHGGRYIFYRARLQDVVQEIESYRPGRIVIATSALADERVTGSFALDDTEAALGSLQASVGFRMNTIAGRLTVISP